MIKSKNSLNRSFSSSSAMKSTTQLTTIPTAVIVYLGVATFYSVFTAVFSIGIFLSNSAAITVPAECTELASSYLNLIIKIVDVSTRIIAANPEIVEEFQNFLLEIINTFSDIIDNFNVTLEGLDTMDTQYDRFFDIINRLEQSEAQLRILYRGVETRLGVSIEQTELLPRPYELVFDDYIYALGGDPDAAAQAAGESPVSSGSVSSDDMDID